MIYLLDTDHISELQGIAVAGRRLTVRLGEIAPDDYGTTIITFEEQIRGRLAQAAASKAAAASEVTFYARLNGTLRFYQNIAVWQYTQQAALRCAALRSAKIRVGTQDLKIAGIALSAGATLLTRNTRDFAQVPDLLTDVTQTSSAT